MTVELALAKARSPAAGQRRLAVALSVGIGTLSILVPALINGFPFIFHDSGTYLRAAVELRPTDDRPIFYSLFVLPLHMRLSPWPIVIVQSLLVALTVRILARSVFGLPQPWITGAVCVVLSAITGLPWFAGQIMADIFAPLLIVALLVVTMGWERMSRAERLLMLVLIAASVTFHFADLPIALTAVPAVAVLALLGWRPGPEAWQRVVLVAAAVLLAVAALTSVSVVLRGRYVVSTSSSTFLLAKFIDDGPALEVLKDDCPGAYKLCSQLDRLVAHKQSGAEPRQLGEYFLWYGPVEDLGWFKAVEPEAAVVVAKTLRRYWWDQTLNSLADGASQFLHFRVGEGLWPLPDAGAPTTAAGGEHTLTPFVTESIGYALGDRNLAAFNRSLQAQGKLDWTALNAIQPYVFALSLVALCFLSVWTWRSDRITLYVTAFTLVMLAGHALIIGILVPLHDRYQARVAWLLPLMAILAAIRAVTVPTARPSGLVPTKRSPLRQA